MAGGSGYKGGLGRRSDRTFLAALVLPAMLSSAFGAPVLQSSLRPLFGTRAQAAIHTTPFAPIRHIAKDDVLRLRAVTRRPAPRRVEPVRAAYCVRLCDGLAIPLGSAVGRNARPAQEAACAATCPGAETALYIGRTSGEGVATASAARDGRRYSALPTAFAYTQSVAPTCACGTPSSHGGDLVAVLRDMTLRHGDAVMTSRGFRVFAGDASHPHHARDFEPLARSRTLDPTLRGTLRTIEVASLAAAPHDTFVALDLPAQRADVQLSAFQAMN